MKIWKLLAVVMAVLLCLTACGVKPQEQDSNAPVATKNPDTPDTPDEPPIDGSGSGIPDPVTDKTPTAEGETYQANGMYIGMADNNVIVIIEANPEDGRPEKSYQISPEIDLDALGITDGSMITLDYTVDANGVKRVKTISVAY